MSVYLSKSKYCLGVRCPKMLWLSMHRPEKPNDDGSASNGAGDSAEDGKKVGELARTYFGACQLVPYGRPADMIAETARLLEQGTEYIAEASFAWDGCFCSVDILKNLGGNRVEICEVKGVVNLEDKHYQDAAFQNYVLTKLGYQVERVELMHLNKDYIRKGDLDLGQLFRRKDVTGRVREMLDTVAGQITRLMPCIEQTEEPATEAIEACFASKDKCEFPWYCYRHLDSPNICDLHGHTKADVKAKLYNEGFRTFRELYDSKKLKGKSRHQVEFEVEQKSTQINRKQISAFLHSLSMPLYFLDFETYMPTIPPFDQTKPNDQIVFQYSLHHLDAAGGELKHAEHLAQPGGDPRRALAEQLCRDIPRDVCILAYHDSVEKGIVRRLAQLYPDLREHLENIEKHIKDLETPFKERHYYTRDMAGTSTIKRVLPALFPGDDELNYDKLTGIHKGTQAMSAYLEMCEPLPDTATEAERNARAAKDADTRRNLLAYCKLDTLAMVRLWEKLNEIS